MLYLDSSSLLKLLWRERESEAVGSHVASEDAVIVSSLAELETEVQLAAAWLAGRYGTARWRRFRQKLAEFRATDPFRFRPLPGSVFETARDQLARSGRVHCRTLDRLHLAGMTELEVARLMTHDAAQAHVARALGFEVIVPGR
ncbi:MAG: PIN domain-containing protein [Candidatus Rokuibacteriota bacterium]